MTNAFTTSELAQRIPSPVSDCDVRALPLSPNEAFLLSRIDGRLTEEDLGSLTGVDVSKLRDSLERLARLGAIRWAAAAHEPRAAMKPAPAPPPRQAPSGRRFSQVHIQAVSAEAAPTEAPSDLEPERERRILDMYARLPYANYYALLGVSETADRKDVKRGYYGTAPEYHPDKFFGRRLGSLKPKLEAIFAQLTFAYETLSSPDKRAAYDTYRATQKATRSMEELLCDTTQSSGGAARRSPSMPPATPPPERARGVQHVSTAAATPVREVARSATQPTNPSSMPPRTADEERARRATLARKLSGGRGTIPPDPRRTSPQPDPAAHAADELRRRQHASNESARRAQVQRHLDAGRAALGVNPAAAANAYRLALALDPENPEIIHALRDASRAAATALAQGYLKQGEYETRAGQLVDAARSYKRAAAGMPTNPDVLELAAAASLKAGVDMHQTVQLAREAIALAPERLASRYVLIEAYLAANLPLAARREIESAREMAPQDDILKELFKRLK